MGLWRRSVAEYLGTLLLVATVVGSGIAGDQMSDSAGLALLINAIATAGVLLGLILTLGPVSGAHFNPLITAADVYFGARPWRELGPYAAGQVLGALTGVVVGNGMFGSDLVRPSTHDRLTGPHLLAETVATFGLVLIVFTLVRTGRTAQVAASVAGYIAAAYFFTSSTSFANPAVTVGRAFTDTFAGIAPASVPGFVLAQILGAALGVGAVLIITPRPAAADGFAIDEVGRA